MKKISLKIKRKIVDNFLLEINKKLKSYKFDLNTISYLSKRSIFKLLKLSYQADGDTFDKLKLKQTSKFLFDISREEKNKKRITKIFNDITSDNMDLLVEKTASDFIAISEQNIDNSIYSKITFKNIFKKQYLLLEVLRI
ncbi:MAG: hypothetical protein KAG14_00815 [Mycoplasmataceae bacterium]|nr:hypothetical protein [Mycoplasmataceae bacterium]